MSTDVCWAPPPHPVVVPWTDLTGALARRKGSMLRISVPVSLLTILLVGLVE